MFLSTDSGVSWTRSQLDTTANATVVAVSPTFDTDGIFVAGTTDGIFVSSDRAET